MPNGQSPTESHTVTVNLRAHHLDWVSPENTLKNKHTVLPLCCLRHYHNTWLPSTESFGSQPIISWLTALSLSLPRAWRSNFIQESGFKENGSGTSERKLCEKKGKRTFIPSWKGESPWVRHDDRSRNMHCVVCCQLLSKLDTTEEIIL